MSRARLAVGAVALLVDAACGDAAYDSAGSAPQPVVTTVAATARAGSSTSDTTVAAVSRPIVERVREAFYRLFPSEAALAGFSINLQNDLDGKVRACMADRRLEYDGSPPTLHGPRPDVDVKGAYGVDPAWENPPDRYGTSPGPPPSPEDVDETAVGGSESTVTPDRPAGYDAALSECSGIGPVGAGWDDTLYQDLKQGFRVIGAETKNQPGFADLQAEYVACIANHGFSFTDPSDILSDEIMDAQVMAPEALEADIECRQPLYEAFIELGAASWATWLDERDADIATVEALFGEWESVALDAWAADNRPDSTATATP